MRICHLITRLIVGGAQENTLLACADLKRLFGDEVLLISGPGLGPEGSLVDRARALRIPMVLLPDLRREIHLGRDRRSQRQIKEQLRSFRPDIVHTHSGKAGLLGRRAAHALNVPGIIHTVHGAPFHAYQGRAARTLLQRLEKYAARRCHAIVSVADAMTEQLVAAGVAPREKFTTIYSGMEVEPLLRADASRRRVRKELGYQDEHVVVGKVARLFHLKGHEDVIAAAGKIVAAHPQVRFLFVGDGLLAGRLRAAIARQGLSEYFQFTGLVPPEEVPRFLGAMDLVVHTSLREGLARVLPQALIAGKPVVSYDIDGAREVVIPDVTGYLLQPRDTAALANAVGKLVEDAPRRAQMGREGRQRFAELFQHETMTRQLRLLYEQVLNAGDQRA